MKKTLIALGLAGVMVLGGAMSVMAEETDEAATYDYSMIDGDVYDGTWVTCLDVFDLYLPSEWNIVLNAESDDEAQNNVYFMAENDDETQSVAISYAPSEFTDINDLAAAYESTDGMSDVEVITVNDIDCVSYIAETDDVWTAGLAALGDQGGIYNVTVGCAMDDQEDFEATASNILLSFSATQGDEAAEE